jgi:hypothetical protein
MVALRDGMPMLFPLSGLMVFTRALLAPLGPHYSLFRLNDILARKKMTVLDYRWLIRGLIVVCCTREALRYRGLLRRKSETLLSYVPNTISQEVGKFD